MDTSKSTAARLNARDIFSWNKTKSSYHRELWLYSQDHPETVSKQLQQPSQWPCNRVLSCSSTGKPDPVQSYKAYRAEHLISLLPALLSPFEPPKIDSY